jgi:hypothetical protein
MIEQLRLCGLEDLYDSLDEKGKIEMKKDAKKAGISW